MLLLWAEVSPMCDLETISIATISGLQHRSLSEPVYGIAFSLPERISLDVVSSSVLSDRRCYEGRISQSEDHSRREAMPQYLVAIHHPDNYDPSLEGEAMRRDIGALNKEMVAAGVRIFVGGLQSARNAKSLRVQANGEVTITDGPYIEAKEHVGGFWVLEAANIDEALVWGRKAVVACRAPVEVREFGVLPKK
jgi:hypothetical protein